MKTLHFGFPKIRTYNFLVILSCFSIFTFNIYASEILSNTSFDTDTSGWYCNVVSPASATYGRTTSVYDSSPASYQISSINQGTAWSQIQFYTTNPISISENTHYLLTFRAKASQSFTIDHIALIKGSSPYTGYGSYYDNRTPVIGTDWETHEVIITANCDATDARIVFGLGASLDTTLYIDSLSFKVTIINPTTYYVDATLGDDDNNGTTTSTAWKTLYKVNTVHLYPGDNVLFKRGETWRGCLQPQGGNSAGGRITYGAYGDIYLPKPLFLGSAAFNNTSDWTNTTGNIWSTTAEALVNSANTIYASEILSNTSFDTSTSGWYCNVASPASATYGRTTSVYDSSPASYQISSNVQGTNWSQIQFYTINPISISEDKHYLLTFRAKASQSFTIDHIALIKGSSPYSEYSSYYVNRAPEIGTDWETYKVIIKANCDATDARIVFGLGASLDTTVNIDSLSFKECYSFDVGNIIFNYEDSCGTKVWTEAELSVDKDGSTPIWIPEEKQGRFWFDPDNLLVKMYSTSNPASYYEDIELALRLPVINNVVVNYVNYENLDLRYSGNFGITITYSSYIDIKECDISFIGGTLNSYYGDLPVRYGNGIELYNSGNNIVIEKCKISNIYDAGMSNQGGSGVGIHQNDLFFRNNIIWNCEYGYEYFLGADAEAYDIYIENNTFAYAGYGWGHWQRTDGQSAYHVRLGTNNADTTDFYIRNNIFAETLNYCLRVNNASAIILDNNLYYTSEGGAVKWEDDIYSMADFDDYQTDTGKDQNSIAEYPNFVDLNNLDFHLQTNSPAIDTGTNIAHPYDFQDNSRPIGTAYDIGAYECDYSFSMCGLVAHWKLDENSTGDVIDSYNKNHGVNNNGTAIGQTGVIGNAYNFDGINDKITVPAINCDEITLSAWFYKESNDTVNADAIWGGWHWNANPQLQEGYELRFYPTAPDELRFIIVTENSTGTRYSAGVQYTLSNYLNQWHHAVGTYNKTTGVQTLYVDGQPVATKSHPAGNTIVPLTSRNYMTIGYGINTGYFDGKIDEVKIFNRSLSANEIAIAFSANIDEGTGSYVNDSSAYGNGGTISGANWTTGISGKALSFDGINDKVTVPAINCDEITLSAWFYKESNDTVNADAIWGGWHWNANPQLQEGYELRFYPTAPDELRFIIVTENSTGTRYSAGVQYTLSNYLNQWHHAVGTYNKTTGVQTLYIDGQPVATKSHPAGNTIVPLTSRDYMTIGYGINTGYFDGKIDEVKIYRRAFSATEVDDLYDSY